MRQPIREVNDLVISIKDLSFRHPQQSQPVLSIGRWQVAAGERLFLHGPSGSGKSTLLNLLCGILVTGKKPNRGEIEVLGQPLHTLSGGQRDQWRARHIGVVFQQFNLIPYLSAEHNILLAAKLAKQQDARARCHQLLNALGIEPPLLKQPARHLSIGQQQRVAIARSFINRPELLIVDEPTSALDSANRDAFMSLLLEQVERHQSTLVFVSHDLSLTSGMSRVQALADINNVDEIPELTK